MMVTSFQSEMVEDAFTPISGADGEVTWSQNPSTLSTVTITLMSSSPSNDVLECYPSCRIVKQVWVLSLCLLKTILAETYLSLMLLVSSRWQQLPKVKEVGSREWTISLQIAKCSLVVTNK